MLPIIHDIVIHSESNQLVLISSNEIIPLFQKNTFISDHLQGFRHTGLIRTAKFNKEGTLFVTSAEDKLIRIWKTTDWTCIGTRKTSKKVSSAILINESTLLWSDRVGNVFQISLVEGNKLNNENGNEDDCIFLLGHCSWVIQMELTNYKDQRYLITSDKDEHIRVSRYPQTYDIVSYCLNHSGFVSVILPVEMNQISYLISGGGDGQICLWDFTKGLLLSSYTVESDNINNDKPIIRSIAINGDILAVLIEGLSKIELFKISFPDISNNDSSSIIPFNTINTSFIPLSLIFHEHFLICTIGGVYKLIDNTLSTHIDLGISKSNNSDEINLDKYSLNYLKKGYLTPKPEKENENKKPPKKRAKKNQ